ncbi:hypothetical protein Lepto7375DRAFT_1784 [Leptolyngbya sp. PCC 7375]|nr:hypothetical protein Lepto7375DRAFT_1784 [Leptolyngbya sp. PCC 7375]
MALSEHHELISLMAGFGFRDRQIQEALIDIGHPLVSTQGIGKYRRENDIKTRGIPEVIAEFYGCLLIESRDQGVSVNELAKRFECTTSVVNKAFDLMGEPSNQLCSKESLKADYRWDLLSLKRQGYSVRQMEDWLLQHRKLKCGKTTIHSALQEIKLRSWKEFDMAKQFMQWLMSLPKSEGSEIFTSMMDELRSKGYIV